MTRVTFLATLVAVSVLAGGCYHAQTGPLLGYTIGQGPMLGWEGGVGLGPFGGTIGGELRPFGDRVGEGYVAFEPSLALPLDRTGNAAGSGPFLSLGGTAGAALDASGVAALAGGWAGVPWVNGSGTCGRDLLRTMSISAGVHIRLDGPTPQWTVYATSKLGVLGGCPRFDIGE